MARLPPIDSLPFFDAAMRHSSFASAAAELNVTPSAVSQRIKSLEQSLGVLLFERLPHGLKPTEAARLYLLEIRPALTRLRTASTRIATQSVRRPAGRGHRLSVDMLPALATARIGPMLRRFYERFPDVELRLTTSPGISDPALDGFDCCVRYGPGGWQGIDAQCLAEESVFPVCAPAFAANRAPVVGISDLAPLPLIHDLMPLGWAEWLAAFGGPELQSKGPVFSDSALAQRAAVEGLGVALGRSLLVAPDLASGRLTRLLRQELRSPFSYWLVRPMGRRDALVDLFGEWLCEEILVDGGVEGDARS
jgi:LysR family glycine cleavage system transcriptional activator